jgi:hypothetical protein
LSRPVQSEVPISAEELTRLREFFELLDGWDRELASNADGAKTVPRPKKRAKNAQKGVITC